MRGHLVVDLLCLECVEVRLDADVAQHLGDGEQVAAAERLVEAMAEAERQGLMAIAFEGRMVDVPHLNQASRLLDRARQIGDSR